MSQASGIREIGYFDCPGGGQVVVDGTTAYIGHIAGPEATTVVDVSDPRNPRQVHQLTCRHASAHAHKVRARNGLMLTNYESVVPAGDAEPDFRGGLHVFDLADPHKPEPIAFWPCDGTGVHRFTFDGRYAYISPEIEGYDGNICMILDLKDPARPEEVGRWHMPGQWIAGGETPGWGPRQHRCHHPMRLDDRLYVSYWHGGWVILDISDMTRPEFVSGMDWSPPFPWPTHTCLPIPFEVAGRRIMLVADEDVAKAYPSGPSFLWVVDITDEAHPMPFSSYQMAGLDGAPTPAMTGCHQPVEHVRGAEIPVAWFAQGLRVIDIADPFNVKEIAHYVPDLPEGSRRVCSNDVFQDDRGLIYVIDRVRGLNIVEPAWS